MADHSFEGGAPPEFLFDLAVNSALPAADLGASANPAFKAFRDSQSSPKLIPNCKKPAR
jgi:hypothetical protein